MVIDGAGGHLLNFPKAEERWVNKDDTFKKSEMRYQVIVKKQRVWLYALP